MRKASSVKFHKSGVSLGADYVAEHECGIQPIRKAFGPNIPGRHDEHPVFGVARRICTSKGLLALKHIKERKIWILWCGVPEEILLSILDRREVPTPQGGAWDDRSFCVCAAEGSPEAKTLMNLFEADQNGGLLIHLGAFGESGGLHLLVADKVPLNAQQDWLTQDKASFDLREQWVRETGPKFESNLRKAGLDWFNLGLRYTKLGDGTLATWLNPYEQRKYNAGWYTAKDLLNWSKGVGPVIKKTGSW